MEIANTMLGKTWGMELGRLMFKASRLVLKHEHVLLYSCCLEGLSAPRPMLGDGCARQAICEANEGAENGG